METVTKKKNTRAITADPAFVHQTQPQHISPDAAQEAIAQYLTRAESRPYMHPDSHLANTGIRFAIGSGPKGGVALHHIRRIEAGLRGELLEKETPEQLEALFGDRWRDVGDDYILDGLIDKSEKKILSKKRKRREDVEDWVSSSSSQPVPEDVLEEINDQYLGYSKYHHEIESFANTPVHRPSFEEQEGKWQDPHEYELNQRVWRRDPQEAEAHSGAVATAVMGNGKAMELVEHDAQGNVVKEPKQAKEERKKAKKERSKHEKAKKIREAEENRARKLDLVKERVEGADEEQAKEARKEEMARRKSEKRRSDENEDEEERRRADKRARKKEKEQKKAKATFDEDVDSDARKRRKAERKQRKQEKRDKKTAKENG